MEGGRVNKHVYLPAPLYRTAALLWLQAWTEGYFSVLLIEVVHIKKHCTACFAADRSDGEEVPTQTAALGHQLLSMGKLSVVVSDLLRFLRLGGRFRRLKLLAFAELHRYQLSLLRVQFLAAVVPSRRILFGLRRELLQFLFNGNKVWTVLKLVLLFRWQGLPQFRIARQGHGTEQIVDNVTWLVAEVAVLTVRFRVSGRIEITIHISASVSAMLYPLSQ